MEACIHDLETLREGPQEATLRVHVVGDESECYGLAHLLARLDRAGGDLHCMFSPSMMGVWAEKMRISRDAICLDLL